MLILWIAVAAVSALVELIATSLLVLPFSVGALAALGILLAGGAAILQVIAFLTLSFVAYLLFVPLSRKLLNSQSITHTNTQALLGQAATTLSPVDFYTGQIKLGGEIWTARSWEEDEAIKQGCKVEVVRIDGATAVVRATDREDLAF